MDNLDEFYREYGLSLATRLADIAHSEMTPRFVFVEDPETSSEVLKFIQINNTKIPPGQPVLVWDNFEEDLSTSGRDNFHFELRGSLSVIQKTTATSATKAQAYARGRAIVLKALALMLQDAGETDQGEEGSLLEVGIQVEVRQFPLQKIGPVSADWYGYGVEFSWTVPADLSLSEDDLLAAS